MKLPRNKEKKGGKGTFLWQIMKGNKRTKAKKKKTARVLPVRKSLETKMMENGFNAMNAKFDGMKTILPMLPMRGN